MAKEVKIIGTFDDQLSGKVRTAVGKSNTELGKVGGQNKKLGDSFSKLGGLILPAFAIGGILKFSKASLAAYDVQIKAENELSRALGYRSDLLLKQASALQKVTLFGDEATIAAQATMAAFIKDDEIIAQLIPRVQDLATAKGMDLNSAAEMVTKSIAGEINALGRLGISLGDAKTQSEKAKAVTIGLDSAFKGAASTAASAGTGGLTQLKNTMGDISEKVGKFLLPSLNAATSGISSLATATDSLLETFNTIDFSDSQKDLDDFNKKMSETFGGKIISKNADDLAKELALRNTDIKKSEEEAAEIAKKIQEQADKDKLEMIAKRQAYVDGTSKREQARKARETAVDEWQRQKDSDSLYAMIAKEVEVSDLKKQISLSLMDQTQQELLIEQSAHEARMKILGESSDALYMYSENVSAIKEQGYARDAEAQRVAVDEQIKANNELADSVGNVSTIITAFSGSNRKLFAAEALARGVMGFANAMALPFPANLGAFAVASTQFATMKQALTTKAASGADFVTNGPQLMMVGENAGGRERVTVTPHGSPNVSGGGGEGSINIIIHGGASGSTVRALASESRRLQRGIKDARRMGYNV